MDNFLSFLIAAAIIGGFLYFHLRAERRNTRALKPLRKKARSAPKARNRNIRTLTIITASAAPPARLSALKAMSSG